MNLDEYFRFKIGELVIHKMLTIQPIEQPEWPNIGTADKVCMCISERLLHECSGGVQKTYGVRQVNPRGGCASDPFRINEIELAPLSECYKVDVKVWQTEVVVKQQDK